MMRGPWLLAALAVTAAVVLVHAGSLGGDFVYDDHRFIEHNGAIRSMPVVEAFTNPATASHGDGIVHDIYRPLRTVLFSLQYALFATERADGRIDHHLAWWHAVSVLLHLANTLLVLRLLRTLARGALLPAALGALLFGVHPLTSESVAWLSSQGDLLAMTLLLGALVVMERPGRRRTVGGVLCFLLACLAKESALMLPLLLPLRDAALPRGAEDGGPTPWPRTTWTRTGLLACAACAYFVLRMAVLPGLAQVGHVEGSPLATARAMLHGVGWYAQALLLPVGFTFDTRLEVPARWSDPEVWVGLGILGTLVAAGVWGLRSRRTLLAFACLGVLVALGPVSNVIVPLKTFVADRFFYPGLLCVAAGLAALLARLRETPRAAAITVVLAVLGVFGWMTAQRNAAWADEFSLWDAVRRDRPSNANAYQGIAYEFAKQRRIVDAENAYATYLEANPRDGKAIYVMGSLMGELAESLVLLTPGEPGWSEEDVSHRLRQRQARVAQIRLYQRAFVIWNGPGGLEQGRGSETMVQDMLGRWIAAGVALGDLATASYANDRLMERESQGALDPRDPQAVWAQASWPRRRARAEFVFRVLRVMNDKRIPKEIRARIVQDRARILRGAGLDPSSANRALLVPLIDIAANLQREALAAPDFQPDPFLFRHHAGLLVGVGRLDHARAVLRSGLKVWPDDPGLRDDLRALAR